MPIGIASFGAYIPLYRLKLASIAQVWGGSARHGEKAVANCTSWPRLPHDSEIPDGQSTFNITGSFLEESSHGTFDLSIEGALRRV